MKQIKVSFNYYFNYKDFPIAEHSNIAEQLVADISGLGINSCDYDSEKRDISFTPVETLRLSTK